MSTIPGKSDMSGIVVTETSREAAAMSVLHDPKLEGLLAGLHARSDEQLTALRTYDAERINEAQPTAADKAEFCYQLCRANNARRIVEIGTSYGVSTLYLAAAVRDNIAASGGEGVV